MLEKLPFSHSVSRPALLPCFCSMYDLGAVDFDVSSIVEDSTSDSHRDINTAFPGKCSSRSTDVIGLADVKDVCVAAAVMQQ